MEKRLLFFKKTAEKAFRLKSVTLAWGSVKKTRKIFSNSFTRHLTVTKNKKMQIKKEQDLGFTFASNFLNNLKV